MSGATDCYQPAERTFRLTRGCLEALDRLAAGGVVFDRFRTENHFYGGQVGLQGETRRGRRMKHEALALADAGQVDKERALLVIGEDHTATGPTEGLVRRGGDEMAVRNGRRMEPSRHQAGDVGDVGHEQGTHLVGDGAEAREVDDPAVGAGAADDQLGPLGTGERLHRVVIDALGLPVHSVGDDLEVAPRIGEPVAMREMAAAGEVQAHQLVAGLEHGEIDGHVGRGAAVRLHVGVLRAEELLRPLDGEDLDLVYLLASTVVPLARIALGVLVRQDGALGGEHGRGGEVLARYKLYRGPLALEFPVQGLLDQAIYDFGVRSDHALPPLGGWEPARRFRRETVAVKNPWGSNAPASSLPTLHSREYRCSPRRPQTPVTRTETRPLNRQTSARGLLPRELW